MTSDVLYYEDIEVGRRDTFGRHVVDRDEMLGFARRFDPQPFHLSDEAAAATHFGRLAASGWYTAAMAMAMLVEHMQETGFAGAGSPGLADLQWRAPVFPGDTLRCETEVLATRRSHSRPTLGLVTTRMTVFNQDDRVALTHVSTVMVTVRPSTRSASAPAAATGAAATEPAAATERLALRPDAAS